MVKSFTKNGKFYFCKLEQNGWSQWACRHEDGLETWAKVSKSNPTRKDVIEAIERVDC